MTEKAKKPEFKTEKKEAPKERKVEKNIKGIKRIAGRDVSGDYTLFRSLLRVRGIGKSLCPTLVKLISEKLAIPPQMQVGDLSDVQIEQIDQILSNLHQYNLPYFMLNRRKDITEGTNKHVIMNDLIFAVKQDIDREKNIYTWKGYRHAYRQKVRGQRTRNTGRIGMSVGVIRKAVLAQTKGATPSSGAPATGKTSQPAAKSAEKK